MSEIPETKKPVQRYALSPDKVSVSERQERRLAARLGRVSTTHRPPGSGRGAQKADVRVERICLVEAKTVEGGKASISLKKEHLLKITREAEDVRLAPLLVVSFPEMPVGIDNDYAVVPMRVFNELLEAFLDVDG